MDATAERLLGCSAPLEQASSRQVILTVVEQEINNKPVNEKEPQEAENEQPCEEINQQLANNKKVTTPKPTRRVKIKWSQEQLSPKNDPRYEVLVPNEIIIVKKPQQLPKQTTPPQKKSKNCEQVESKVWA